MTTHELLELAVLDAHGMLDDHERRGFERSMSAASDAIQRQIRREQARLVDLTGLLPEDAPSPGLRGRVIDAIRAEIKADRDQAPELAPSLASTAASRTVQHDADSLQTPRRLRKPARVSALWRAGSLGLSAAAITLAVLLVNLRSEYQVLARDLNDNSVLDSAIRTIGPDTLFDTLFDSSTVRVTFAVANAPEQGVHPLTAAVFYNPDWSAANLYCKLPSSGSGSYQLAVVDDDGNISEVVHEFESNGGLMTAQIAGEVALNASRLSIFRISETGTATLMLTAVIS